MAKEVYFNFENLEQNWLEFREVLKEIDAKNKKLITIAATYNSYLKRQARDIEIFKKDEGLLIPDNIDYNSIKSLSNEVREKLIKSKHIHSSEYMKSIIELNI